MTSLSRHGAETRLNAEMRNKNGKTKNREEKRTTRGKWRRLLLLRASVRSPETCFGTFVFLFFFVQRTMRPFPRCLHALTTHPRQDTLKVIFQHVSLLASKFLIWYRFEFTSISDNLNVSSYTSKNGVNRFASDLCLS